MAKILKKGWFTIVVAIITFTLLGFFIPWTFCKGSGRVIKFKYTIKLDIDTYDFTREENIDKVNTEIEALKKKATEENSKKQVEDLDLANKAVIEAHQKYEEECNRIRIGRGMTNKEQEVAFNRLDAEYQANETLYKEYQAKRKELDLWKIVSDKESR